MRIEELAYTCGGATRSLALHPSLTVIMGLDAGTRRAWAQRIFEMLHCLSGEPASGDRCLERVVLAEADPVPADWLRQLGVEAERTARHMLLNAEALSAEIEDASDPDADSDELRELRALVEAAEAEHVAAIERHQELDKLRQRHLHLEALVHASDERLARNRHGQAVLEVSRLEAELALLGGGSSEDRQWAETARRAARAADAWRSAAEALEETRQAFGGRTRLDPAQLTLRLAQPTEPPLQLVELYDRLRSALRDRDSLLARLQDQAAAELPDTATPWARDLARLDQANLWARADHVTTKRRAVVDLALGLGDPDGRHGQMVAELGAAHDAVELAERAVERTRFPALSKGAKRTLAEAREQELAVAQRAGFDSWLGFQLRRVDATLRPGGLDDLRAAEEDLARCEADWARLAPGVELETALQARPEIEGLAAALAAAEAQRGSCEALRQELAEIAEPAVAAARAALTAAYAPFGVGPEASPTEIESIAAEARLARLQVRLVEAEGVYEEAEADLERLLAAAGLPGPAPLATRAAIVTAQFGDPGSEPGPHPSRSRDEVAAQLRQARDEARTLARPDWNDTDLLYEMLTEEPSEDESHSPDHLALLSERDRVADEIDKLTIDLPDEELLAERRYELARRLESLSSFSRQARLDAAEMAVIRRFAHTRGAGPDGEPLPLVFDDALRSFPTEDKAELLALIARLSGASQVLYLTDDDEAIDWAEAHQARGIAALLDAAGS